MGVNLPPLPDGIGLRPHGRSGLKYRTTGTIQIIKSLRPHGRSGLKSAFAVEGEAAGAVSAHTGGVD